MNTKRSCRVHAQEATYSFCKNNFMKKECVIYLSDLVHNYASKGPHTFPINIGCIASYAKKIYGETVRVRLFKFPLDLINAIKEEKPDIVGLSNYTWNTNINDKMISWIKSCDPGIVTVFGGPDYPVDGAESSKFLKRTKDLDFYTLFQGERGFVNIIKRYFESDSLSDMKKDVVENCAFFDEATDSAIVSGAYNWLEDLEEIPSPYLTGILDEFFKDNLIPLIETNRGCPYSCTYCAWGNASQKKIFKFSVERVKKEIEYIAKKIEGTGLLMICDANFGIFERDIEIAGFLKNVNEMYGYPKDIFMAWAKTNPSRIIEIATILKGITGISSAFGSFQTTDPHVMSNIKRTNFSFEEFKAIQEDFIRKDLSVSSELILGLPGETKNSHLEGLKKLFDCNTQSIVCYNLRMLGGSELNTEKHRSEFAIKTKFRLIDGGFGKYGDIVSIESEEMVLSTSSMTSDDILYFRPIHFLIQFLWNYKYYSELIIFLGKENINPVDYIAMLMSRLDAAPDPVKGIFSDFAKDSCNEWFDSRQSLSAHYSQSCNFDLISRGGFGKLNYKYTYRMLLENRQDFEQYLVETAFHMLDERNSLNKEIEGQLNDIMQYLSNKIIDFSAGLEGVKNKKTLEVVYDILKWRREVFQKPLAFYTNRGVELKFTLPERQIDILNKLRKQFEGYDANQTLRKMAEYMNEKDLFYSVDYK